MTKESIRAEIEWKKNEVRQINTRIGELHGEINDLENDICELMADLKEAGEK